ncbi:MAG: methyltransferase domain-containing protein [Sediminicola sp.]
MKYRNTDPETMDDPQLPEPVLRKVLMDITRVNRLLNGNRITLRAILRLVRENPQREYTIVDMGCGDGYMLRAVADLFRKKGIPVRLMGIDLSAKGIALARKASLSYPQIEYMVRNILNIALGELKCDILLCTLTMHHFSDSEIPVFMERFIQLSTIGVVVNDLQRSWTAYYLFKFFSLIFIKTDIGRSDGLISIKSGFLKKELQAFSELFPTVHHTIRYKWAFRYLWLIRIKFP